MIRTLSATAFGAVFSLFLILSNNANADVRIGQTPPDFQAVDTNGNPVSLSALKGKTVVLEWTNHGCPFVRKHYGSGNMQAIQKDVVSDDLVWLSIISSAPGTQGYVDAAEANELTASRNAAPSGIILDPSGDIGRAYDAKTTPHMYIVNPEGTLVYMGGIDDKPSTRNSSLNGAKNYVRQALTEMASNNPVSEPQTRAYGCSVKYGS